EPGEPRGRYPGAQGRHPGDLSGRARLGEAGVPAAEGVESAAPSLMFELSIALPAVINGLMAGAIYALVALGLTLIYGVLHIINFAHGNLLMLALYAVYFLLTLGGIDPYAALPLMIVGAFGFGYVLYRFVIARLSHG